MSRSSAATQVTFEEFLDLAVSEYESEQPMMETLQSLTGELKDLPINVDNYSENRDVILYAVGESLKTHWNGKPTKKDLKMIFDLWKNKQLLAVMGKFALLGMEDH